MTDELSAAADPRLYTAHPLVGVGVVVIRDGQVLLIRRAKPPRAGHWSLPGGMQQIGETVREAGIREVREETGLEVTLHDLLDVIDMIEPDDAGRVRRHYTLIDFRGTAAAGEPVAGDDAADARWFTPEELTMLDLWSKTRAVIDQALARAGAAGTGTPEG